MRMHLALIAVTLWVLVSSPGHAQQVLLSDDFNNGDAAGWQTFEPGWSVQLGVYHSSNTGADIPVESVWAAGYGWTDYSVEADVRTLSDYEPADGGITFRYQTGNQAGDLNAKCRLFQYGGRFLQLLAPDGVSQVPFSYVQGQWYRLRATATGNTLTCQVVGVPGTLLTQTSAAVPASGTVGFRATHIPGDFDNVVVDAPWYAGVNFAAAGVVAYWPLDGTARDVSGAGHDGTLFGNTTFGPNRCGTGLAASFDGSGDYIEAAGQVAYGDAFSACGWMLKSGLVENGISYLFIKTADVNYAYQSLGYNSAPNLEEIHVDVSNFGNPWYLNYPVHLANGEWHHLCTTVQPGDVRIYLDGAQVAQAPLTGSLEHGNFTGNFIGGFPHILYGPYSHNGLMGDVIVFDRALSAAEVAALTQDANNDCIADYWQTPVNQPPIALCHAAAVDAGPSCSAQASIDAGSYDPDGGQVILSQTPPGPYALGVTPVTLTVMDPQGASASCQATVTVVDHTAPAVACNAPATIVRRDDPISFTATGADNCSLASVLVHDYDCFAYKKNGKRIDKRDSCEVRLKGSTATILDAGGVGDNITWQATAIDGSGNSTTITCAVKVVKRGEEH